MDGGGDEQRDRGTEEGWMEKGKEKRREGRFGRMGEREGEEVRMIWG